VGGEKRRVRDGGIGVRNRKKKPGNGVMRVRNRRGKFGNEEMRVRNRRGKFGNEEMRVRNRRGKFGNEEMRVRNRRGKSGNGKMRVRNQKKKSGNGEMGVRNREEEFRGRRGWDSTHPRSSCRRTDQLSVKTPVTLPEDRIGTPPGPGSHQGESSCCSRQVASPPLNGSGGSDRKTLLPARILLTISYEPDSSTRDPQILSSRPAPSLPPARGEPS
jgi:hypothetical protein